MLSPDEALRFLFRLDAELYSLEGPMAVKYGKGMHPKHRHTNYHDFFVSRIKSGERVLDIGCGTGHVAYDVASRTGALVDAVDLSQESIAFAKATYSHPNLKFEVGDALTMTIEKEYDSILLSNVLEHLNNRPVFLQKIMKVSRAKRIFIRVPLFERDWRVPLKKELGVEWRLDPDHKTEFTLESFAEELAQAGLQLEHSEVHWGEVWAEAHIT
jgi:SAM-dependent methyltransferase